jgi:hypothetical protein
MGERSDQGGASRVEGWEEKEGSRTSGSLVFGAQPNGDGGEIGLGFCDARVVPNEKQNKGKSGG